MRTAKRRSAGLVGGIVMLLVIVAAVALGVQTFYCPCERTPGGWLLGTVERTPVTDWSFANEAGLCQVQVQAGIRPHAINLNCMASDGRLYLSCASCEGKTWSTAALERPAARLRVGNTVYPVTLTRVEDPDVLDEAWRAREGKLGRPTDRPRQDGWWSFHVESRS